MSVGNYKDAMSQESPHRLRAVPPVPEGPNSELLTPKEQELLTSFFNYCQEVAGVDPRQATHQSSPDISFAAHNFISGAVRRRLDALQPEEGQQTGTSPNTPVFYAIPGAPIERRIREYYAEFGTTRRQKSEILREKEETFLEQSMTPLRADAYQDGKRESRINAFPEIELTFRLRDLLASQKNDVAADSAEVVLSAYGQWFLNLASFAGRTVIDEDMYKDSHNALRWRSGAKFDDQ